MFDFLVQCFNRVLHLHDSLLGRLKLVPERLDLLILVQYLLGGVGQLTRALL